MKKGILTDIISISAAATLLVMSILSVMQSVRMDYQVNTGLFSAFMCLLPMILRRLKLISLPLFLVIMVETSIFLHGYGVLLLKYDMLAQWDTITHTISSITVAMCTFVILLAASHESGDTKISPGLMAVMIVVIMLAFGAFWELFELVADLTWNLNMQYSPWDTVRDLYSDAMGATIVSVFAFFYMRRHDTKEFVESLEMAPVFSRLFKRLGSSARATN